MKTIALIIMVATLCEALVEYAKTIMKMMEGKEYKTAITQAITIVLGVGLAFAFNLQLFNNAMVEFYEGLHINPILDMILTGILFSRGSNYFSDFVARLTKKTDDISIGTGIIELPDELVNDVIPITKEMNDIEDEMDIDYSEAENLDDNATGRG
jgi:hypothetical protein